MITKYTYKVFYASKVTDKLPLECEFCHKTFNIEKRKIQSALSQRGKAKCSFCSKRCASKAKTKYKEMMCDFCNKKFNRKLIEIKKNRSEKHFCSKSCSAKSKFYKLEKIMI